MQETQNPKHQTLNPIRLTSLAYLSRMMHPPVVFWRMTHVVVPTLSAQSVLRPLIQRLIVNDRQAASLILLGVPIGSRISRGGVRYDSKMNANGCHHPRYTKADQVTELALVSAAVIPSSTEKCCPSIVAQPCRWHVWRVFRDQHRPLPAAGHRGLALCLPLCGAGEPGRLRDGPEICSGPPAKGRQP